ncbi:phage head-tail connector protein [Terribacillus saccharophilus]|uniref:Phage gp6-like head-tail connector protein n=1 Tax=Terribacillus saccharophilus TaxID=361277 RepID=A0ABX4H0S0_9BACI|nr:phage head-tail connector protein [Terribacillus saccharophilus]PAD36327.1 hypothetical protein CHH56_04870 [Terribacillus saccharophilus]PAD95031.1 hypothetical protein CHH50_15615 [Terribacillus saccharophilus]PAE00746.1 hypothetical protein CHH48_05575 [Terribacillus saccharophilus]
MDLNTVKLLASIPATNTKHDEFIEAKISVLIEAAEDYCNQSFIVNGKYILPAGVKQYVADAIKHDLRDTGLKSRQMGNVTYTFNTDYPDPVTKNLAPYRALRW